ncbi:class I tRNA ligase family protein [Streptomyces sp.]|uniref:class I tRNA ligase family protein n=1 Tax=Streptomyces sp. TaxID=1931 RepID=UPI002F4105A1
MNRSTSRVIITSAPPNPNGDLHLGHLSGPFLGADVLRRHLRQTGYDVRYVGYSDDHSCYVPRRGAELDRGPHATAHVFGRRMEETLGLAHMQHDYFTHPLREPMHADIVRRFFLELWEKDAFRVEELPVYWCEPCERYLYEAEMRGLCQYCAAPADGFYCEECGRPQETTGLVDAKCTRCGTGPQTRTLRRIVFPLDDYRERLRDYYADRPMRPALRAYLDDMLSRPLPLTTVSREADYGVPVPLPEFSGHILDTWYSGIWGYVAATVGYATALGEPEEALEAWADPATRVYEFIGFDCSFSHAILWPALFMAHGGFQLPEQVVTNEFYRLEGDKFSTSRDHAIWGNEFLRRVPADQMRFYLCLTGPEREQTSFSAKDFSAVTQQVLVDGLQTWAGTVLRLTAEDFGGKVPERGTAPGGAVDGAARTLAERVAAALDPDDFSPQAAARALRDAIEVFAADTPELERLRAAGGQEYAGRLRAHLDAAATLAATSAPLIPAFAEQLWTALGLSLDHVFTRVIPWPSAEEKPLDAAGPLRDALPELFRPVTV